ncbi:MAG: MFS transporter [Deltaproteobacteria bacterium]|nr:MFS transporter [Deltaproteobacteria bacterium]
MNLKILILLTAGHFVTDINTGALPAFLPFIKEALALSYTKTASIILIFNITSSVIQPIFGYLSDRWSVRWLLPIGPFLASLGLGLLGLGPSYAWILLFASLSGIGQAIYHPEGFKTVNFLGGQKKATAISLFHFGGNLGFAVGPILATLFFTHFGLKGSLCFVLPGIIMLGVFLFTTQWKIKVSPPAIKATHLARSGPSAQNLLPMTLLLLAVVLRSATRLSLLTFIPFYFITVLNHDPLVAGKYLSVFLLFGTIGVVAGGPLADRFGYKRTVLVSLGLTPVFLYLFLFTSGMLSLVFFAVAGLLIISSNSVTMAMGQSFMPQNVGMASGLILGLAMGIGGIGTTLLGWVADHFGIPFALQITFILPLLAFLVFFFIPYPPHDQAGRSKPFPES